MRKTRKTRRLAEKINLQQCNPATLKTTRTTCLPRESLERLRDEWNKRFPEHRIHGALSKDALWAQVRDRMRRQFECETEYCAVKRLGGGEARYFRPPKPESWTKKPTEWHDSLTISNVLDQYEDAFPTFEFIGPVSIDFDKQLFGRCVSDELCHLNLASMYAQGTRSIGIVFNLDPHDMPGSHWVCAYIDLTAKAVYYYDSYGMEPEPEIRRLMQRCSEQGCTTLMWNDVRHQRKGSECGTYCLYVLISLLKGRSFRDICMKPVDDDTINALRDLLFATETVRPKVADAVKLLSL